MWQQSWRDRTWSELDTHWDIIVVGGGITGAGIFFEAVRAGYKVLLVEAQDFSAGTSSRSSKLVHGGFRYMANAQFKLTYESVHERERLLRDGKGLVNQLDILIPDIQGNKIPGWELGLGLVIYSAMAGKWAFKHLDPEALSEICPEMDCSHLRGGFKYYDANTDDARLTLRVIREAVAAGGTAINYARVGDLLRSKSDTVCGVLLEDQVADGRTAEVQASLVINATGAWADILRRKLGAKRRLRPLQGSHLVFPFSRLPIKSSISIFHPEDNRPVFTLPWEGVTLVGTTDVDVGQSFDDNPAIKAAEVDYLLRAVQHTFPGQQLRHEDILCTMSGIRPVIDTGKKDPSKESREHAIWLESGLLTVTGGKLTTFRLMARDVLKAAMRVLPDRRKLKHKLPLFSSSERNLGDLTYTTLGLDTLTRLIGRYGAESREIFSIAKPGELDQIGETPYLWSELRWASRSEGIVHLDDLLLRRIRLGLLLPEGGRDFLPRIRHIAQPELGWDDAFWDREEKRYFRLWDRAHGLND